MWSTQQAISVPSIGLRTGKLLRFIWGAPVYRGGRNLFNSKLLAPIEFFVIVADLPGHEPEALIAGDPQVVDQSRCLLQS
jgi:hypothetical protein